MASTSCVSFVVSTSFEPFFISNLSYFIRSFFSEMTLVPGTSCAWIKNGLTKSPSENSFWISKIWILIWLIVSTSLAFNAVIMISPPTGVATNWWAILFWLNPLQHFRVPSFSSSSHSLQIDSRYRIHYRNA